MRPELFTERFRLRPFCSQDQDWLAALLADPEVMRFIPRGVRLREQALQEAYDLIYVDQLSLQFGYWAIEDLSNGDSHGWVALKKLNIDDIEVGYRLFKQSWGQGIATEAAARILDYGFRDLGLDRIVAVTMPENHASARVLAKAGLQFERRYPQDGAEWLYFSITRESWPI